MQSSPNTARLPLYERFWMKVHIEPDASSCWEWTAFRNSKGYGVCQLPGGKGFELAHRTSWRLANGDLPDGVHVLHACDNPSCVRPSHLFLGTHTQNMRDMAVKGRMNGSHGIKLAPSDVLAIRRAVRDGATQAALAAQYGVAPTTINNLVKRRTWKHLP